jgi:hypothetical protein
VSRRTLDPDERRARRRLEKRRPIERDDDRDRDRWIPGILDDDPRRSSPAGRRDDPRRRPRRRSDGQTAPARRRRRVLAITGAGLLALAVLPMAFSTLGPAERPVAKVDPRYASQTGSLEATRRQTILNDNEDALDHALETCGAAGVQGLATKFRMAPSIPRLAARYAQDFEVSARRARRAGCAIGLREGG